MSDESVLIDCVIGTVNKLVGSKELSIRGFVEQGSWESERKCETLCNMEVVSSFQPSSLIQFSSMSV